MNPLKASFDEYIIVLSQTSAFVPELQKLTGAELKNQNSKRKSNDSKEMNDEGAGELVSKTQKTADTKKKPKPKGRSKKPSPKRKSKSEDDDDGSDEEAENDDASDDDNGRRVGTKKVRKKTNAEGMLDATSEPEKSLKQSVQSSQNGRRKKKAK